MSKNIKEGKMKGNMRDITSLRPKITPAPQSVIKSLKPKPPKARTIKRDIVPRFDFSTIDQLISRDGLEFETAKKILKDYLLLMKRTTTNLSIDEFVNIILTFR